MKRGDRIEFVKDYISPGGKTLAKRGDKGVLAYISEEGTICDVYLDRKHYPIRWTHPNFIQKISP